MKYTIREVLLNMLYVSMTDKFMSGWGYAKGKLNKLVIACESLEEAEIVRDNAQNRSEMIYINICLNKPRYSESSYYVSWKDKTDMPNWFKPGYFKNQD